MYVLDCCYWGYILFLVLFYLFVFDLVLNIDIFDDVGGNWIDSNWKCFFFNFK